MTEIREDEQTQIEAAAFRRLLSHLQTRSDVQNIDLMNLASFCRNCLSRWMSEEAGELGLTLSKDEARKIVYGMDYDEWKSLYQSEASEEQNAQFETAHKKAT